MMNDLAPRLCLAVLMILALAVPIVASAEQLVGRGRTIDGDTIAVGGVTVRLKGVAAPELQERGGAAAAAFMRDLIEGEIVVCELTNERSWGRRVGVCRLRGDDVGGALIAAGLARDCPRFSGGLYASIEPRPARELPLPGYCRRRGAELVPPPGPMRIQDASRARGPPATQASKENLIDG